MMPRNDHYLSIRMLRVGLTGGIGSGKTTVSDYFATLDVPIVDADEISRKITQPGQEAHDEVVASFGREICDSAGHIDRAKLRELVFADNARRKQLEALLHPIIRRVMAQQVAALSTVYCIISIPLLAEGGSYDLLDRILVVDAPDQLRIEWIKSRSGLTEEAIKNIMAAQASREERLAIADDVIVNDSSLKKLRTKVVEQHRLYLRLAVLDTGSERQEN